MWINLVPNYKIYIYLHGEIYQPIPIFFSANREIIYDILQQNQFTMLGITSISTFFKK